MQIAVVGLGLIGGSMALDLKTSGFASGIIGVDADEDNAQKALDLDLVDEVAPLEQALERCNLMILATPVDQIVKILPGILDVTDSQVIMDVGSTKAPITKKVHQHPKRGRFVPTHPMAGTEYSGPQAAMRFLFRRKATVFCEAERSDPDAVDLVQRLYSALGMPIFYMGAAEHDIHAAYVSHISHISSFALALTVLEKEKDELNIFNLASAGFDSTVRLAKSSKEMWTPIFTQNAANVINVLDTYLIKLHQFREALANQDQRTLNNMIQEANQIRKIL